jgi:heme oxygenase (biliverdin-producing, ferredoxin)
MSLRELTAQKHQDAERTAFAKLLLSGNITKDQYVAYLINMLHIYHALEHHATVAGLFKTLEGIQRAVKIHEDMVELNGRERPVEKVTNTTHDYFTYINSIAADSDKLLAHVYVRHMGDLYGGQMIAKKVPGSGHFYQFDNPEELKNNLRAMLNDSMAPEANVAFDYAIGIMKDLMDQTLSEE